MEGQCGGCGKVKNLCSRPRRDLNVRNRNERLSVQVPVSVLHSVHRSCRGESVSRHAARSHGFKEQLVFFRNPKQQVRCTNYVTGMVRSLLCR